MKKYLVGPLWLLSLWAVAQVKMGSPFSEHMVLQRNKPVVLWGTASPGEKISLSLGTNKAQTKAEKSGKWKATLPALPAGGPYTLTVQGKDRIEWKDILVGDVWVASGQSNMEWKLSQPVRNNAREIADANYPTLRFLEVQNTPAFAPQDTFATPGWKVCTPENAPNFSAVGYFFARHVSRQYNIPVGIVMCEWGGTPAEAWTSEQALATFPNYTPDLAEQKKTKPYEEYLKEFKEQIRQWNEAVRAKDLGSKPENGFYWQQPAYKPGKEWLPMILPGIWESKGLPGFDGIVWFRKEVELPMEPKGNDSYIKLAKIDDLDSVWINGVKVGGNDQWDRVRSYKIPENVLVKGKNTIVVKVMDQQGDGGIYGNSEDMMLWVDGSPFPLKGEWLYRVGCDNQGIPKRPGPNKNQNRPSTLFNGMLHPLIGLPITGAIWYQGESNAYRAYEYRRLFPTMITDWRKRWAQGDFPFLFVQLASYRQADSIPVESDWAELREAQTMTLSLPNTGMATTVDIGDANNIHPVNKQDVGYRLFLQARKVAYGEKDVVASGPTYQGMKVEGGKIKISFANLGAGLKVKDKYGYVRGFAVAAADKKFRNASAEQVGNEVHIRIPEGMDTPVAVRYAWANNPEEANLFNSAGLPAVPFRTDTWPGITEGK